MSIRVTGEDLRAALGIAFAVTVACLPLIVFGPQDGHSLDYNLSWSSRFAQQLLGGEVYPRWLLTMNHGAGSPVFFFYAPVPFYFTALGFVLCGACSATAQLGIGEWLIFVGSGFAFYLFARQHVGPQISMLGAIMYALAPYHFVIDLLTRQAIGEAGAYMWIPVLWLFIDRMLAGKDWILGFALSYALLVATHPPSALLVSLFALIYVTVLAYHESSPGMLLRFITGIVLGSMVSGLYLVPALLSQTYISIDELWIPYYHYARWFLLDGVAAPDPLFKTTLSLTLFLYSLVFAPLSIVGYRCAGRDRVVTGTWLIVFACACFLMLPFSRVVWEYVPFLKKVQFPWRVFVAMDMAVAAALIRIAPSRGWPDRSKTVVIAGAVILLLAASAVLGTRIYVRPWWSLLRSGTNQEKLKSRLETGFDAMEYIPSWVREPEAALGIISSMDRVHVESSAADTADVKVTRWKPRDIQLDMQLDREVEVIVRQFYYPGWKATIDGAATELRIGPSDPAGLIQVRVPAGQHTLRLRLQRLWQEKVGAVLSGLGLVIVAIVGIGRYRGGAPRSAREQQGQRKAWPSRQSNSAG